MQCYDSLTRPFLVTRHMKRHQSGSSILHFKLKVYFRNRKRYFYSHFLIDKLKDVRNTV